MAVGTKHKLVSFGTFEVDMDVGEIRKSGIRVRLPGQPFRLLTALLAQAGEVVTREELQHEIWGANTNVDFERGIASAVNKLREALGDSAEQPLYIETLARKGYRFIAPVRVSDGPLSGDEHTHSGLPAFHVAINSVANASPSPAQTLVSALPAVAVPQYGGHRHAAESPLLAVFAPRFWQVLALVCCVAALVMLSMLLIRSWAPSNGNSAPPHIEQLTQATNIYPGPPNQESFLSIATDGPRLYVPVLVDGRSQLSSLALNGTEPEPISMPDDLSAGAITGISRDGSRLLVRSLRTRAPEQPLWIVPTAGSGASRVGEVLAHDATWMPDDENVLFASGNDLAVVQPGNGTLSSYASLPGRAFWMRWSPDGKKLRFTLLDPTSHVSSLWELDAATRKAHRLSFLSLGNMALCCGTWTPSGDQFTFESDDVHETNIWVVGTSAQARPVQLTNGPIRFTSPLPSREGHTVVAFGVAQPGGTRIYDIAQHRFAPAPRFLQNAQRVTFSRDGAWVAWTDPEERLWRARSKDGADLLRLSDSDLEVFAANWSPDGRQLLLMARQPGKTWQIFTVSASGGATRLLFDDRQSLADPQWSADGSQIVFGLEADLMGKEIGPHDIRLLDLHSRQIRSLPGSQDLFSPRWSPDGLWIAALSRDQARLMVYSVNDQTWKTLFTGGAADPVWSADSRSIYFDAFARPNSAIMMAGVDGKLETVADLSKFGSHTAESYFFSGITPDGSPLIELRVGTGNLYSIELPPPEDHK
jgi:Tol biopolymer transport system component/DNA-binding winged helix-turn-helix (wHTH) protein